MNTKKVIKKLAAVATGASMLGATVMGAFAADLSDYPDMFVSEGTFNGYLVVGESAIGADTVAMTDIATSMWYTANGETTTTTVEGDAWLVATSSNFLELSEDIGDVESYLDNTHLGALADGEISNAKGTSEYEQMLYFDEDAGDTSFQENDEDEVGYFYKVSSGDVIARYVIDFTTDLESDVDSNSDFDDIEDEEISILGEVYTIVEADNATSDNIKLVLMGGAVSASLDEGDVETYTVDGVDYEVELLSVESDEEVQFSINGEITDKMSDSETDLLDDGVTSIGVTEVTYQDYAGGLHRASFFLGADKIELVDGSDLKVNEESVEAAVTMSDTQTGGDVSIDEISINMTADDDYYVAEGSSLSEAIAVAGDDGELLFTQNWDIELAEVSIGDTESISIGFSDSDAKVDLDLALYDGDVSIPLLYANDSAMEGGEREGDHLAWPGMTNSTAEGQITEDDYFFLSTDNPDSASNDVRSYLLQYKSADEIESDGSGDPKIKFDNLATGESIERDVTESTGNFDLKLGGVTFNFVSAGDNSSNDYAINYSSGGDTGIDTEDGHVATGGPLATELTFRTADNHMVELTDTNFTSQTGDWDLFVTVDDSDKLDDTDTSSYVVMNVTFSYDATDDDIDASTGTVAASGVTDPDNNDITYYASAYGEILTVTSGDDEANKYELVVPDSQAEVLLYVTSGATTTATTSDGDLTLVQVVDATKLDSEVSSVSAQNLIVVGGPCVNTVAAELMGNPSDCAEGYTPGVASVKLFENGDYVAMLVAGYSGDDTRLAGKVIANRASELSGEEVEIEGTTYSDATISAPSEEAAVVEEEEEAEEEVEEETTEEEASEDSETTE